MNKPTQTDIEKWAETRRMGVIRYSLLHGVLAWGVPMFFIMTFVVNKQRSDNPALLAVSAALWGFGGLCFGLTMWTISEKKYQKHIASIKPPPLPGQSTPPQT
jgi:hypothetical protein